MAMPVFSAPENDHEYNITKADRRTPERPKLHNYDIPVKISRHMESPIAGASIRKATMRSLMAMRISIKPYGRIKARTVFQP